MKKFCDIENRKELADFLAIKRSQLTYILYLEDINNYYKTFDIPKKQGGVRHIKAPIGKLKFIQKRLSAALQECYNEINKSKKRLLNVSNAFEKGKSIIKNAKIHRNKRYVINFDLEDFFDSFHFGRVKGFFEKNKDFKLPKEVALTIAQLTCYQGTLPQGAPTSPVITNLISQILDSRLLRIGQKYKLDYTRYADDLTFSTNNIYFLDEKEKFYDDLEKEIKRAGFKLNHNKTRLQFKDSKQLVTGLVVNKKINIDRNFYKKTRAMAFALYKNGEFFIEGKKGTINQLEGRFSFINIIDKYNNSIDKNKHNFANLNARERDYKKFLLYKYFFNNNLPLIITEGKTDKLYLKAALKKHYDNYPDLIRYINDKFDYQISFLNRSKRLEYFFDLKVDGADTLTKLINSNLVGRDDNEYNTIMRISKKKPKNPVIFIFDNELNNDKKPLAKFIKTIKISDKDKEKLRNENYFKLSMIVNSNIFIVTIPIINYAEECEIEDLFDRKTLSLKIKGRTLDRKGKGDKSKYYYKNEFAEYIMINYQKINFDGFKNLLNIINDIIVEYRKSNS